MARDQSANGAQASMLPDGKRLHLQHGPIDLIIQADGSTDEIGRAYGQAKAAFDDVLQTLVDELTLLRTAVSAPDGPVCGPVAKRMMHAARAHRDVFVTPMAAVAGAVADHTLMHLVNSRQLRRAYVNNGGDIAMYLSPGTAFRTAVVAFDSGGLKPRGDGLVTVRAEHPVRGIATSGWRGRSYSLGIADSVTVLASDAAAADVAATLIANNVDLPGSDKVQRTPAHELQADSDLGGMPVTTAVASLHPDEADRALQRGAAQARLFIGRGLIHSAFVSCQGRSVACGRPDGLFTDAKSIAPGSSQAVVEEQPGAPQNHRESCYAIC